MFFIGTAQFPLPFRCVLSFGRAAVAVPRGRYAVRSGVRFAAFGGAVRRTFRSGFRTGQGQRVPRHAATSLRVRGEGAVPGAVVIPVQANVWLRGGRSPGRPVSSYRRPVVAEAVFLCGSWRKTFAGGGVSGGECRRWHTILSADGFVAAGAPFRHAGTENAARCGAVSGGPVRGSVSKRSPPGRSVSRTGVGERQGEGRGPRFFACVPPECGSFRKRHYICTVQEPICRIENEAFVRIYRMVLSPLCRAVAFGGGVRSVRKPFGRGRCPLRKPLRGVRSARMVLSGRRVVAERRASPRGRRARFFRGGGRAPSALPGTGCRSGGSSPSFSYGTSGRPARCTAPRQGPYAGRACPVGPLCAGAA